MLSDSVYIGSMRKQVRTAEREDYWRSKKLTLLSLKHEIRINLILEVIFTEDNKCMSMECKPFVQLDV